MPTASTGVSQGWPIGYRYNGAVTTPGSQNATGSDVSLFCHSTTPCTAVRSIRVHVRRSNRSLELQYHVQGDLDHVLVPDDVSPQRGDNLWQHTCFEVFV